MTPREYFLEQSWRAINHWMDEGWIEGEIEQAKKHPNAPFADTAEALERLVALGASRRDLSLLCRQAAYGKAFRMLYLLDESGIDFEEARGLYESILSADPSGMEGRPGSAPRKNLGLLGELEYTLAQIGITVRVLDMYSKAKKVRLYGTPSQLDAARAYFAAQDPPLAVITTLGVKWEPILGAQPPEPE